MTQPKLGEMTLTEALEHHGVLGMKWGRRKDRSASDHEDFSLEPEKNNHTGAKVATGVLVATGAVVAYSILKKSGSVPVSLSNSSVTKAIEAVKTTAPEYTPSGHGLQVKPKMVSRQDLENLQKAIAVRDSNIEAGKKAVAAIRADQFKIRVARLSADIEKGHQEQDAWMRSLGLGHLIERR